MLLAMMRFLVFAAALAAASGDPVRDAVPCAGAQTAGEVSLDRAGVTLVVQFAARANNASIRVTELLDVAAGGGGLRLEYDAAFRALALRGSDGTVLYELLQAGQEHVTAAVTVEPGRARFYLNGSLAYDAASGASLPPGSGAMTASPFAFAAMLYSPPLPGAGAADMTAGSVAPRCADPDDAAQPAAPPEGPPTQTWPCGGAPLEEETRLEPPFVLGINVSARAHARLFAHPHFTADFDPATNFSLLVWGSNHALFRAPGPGAWTLAVGEAGAEATLRVDGERVATARRRPWAGTAVAPGEAMRAEGCGAELWQ